MQAPVATFRGSNARVASHAGGLGGWAGIFSTRIDRFTNVAFPSPLFVRQ